MLPDHLFRPTNPGFYPHEPDSTALPTLAAVISIPITSQSEESTNRTANMAYQSIDGVQYEKELLDLAKKHTTGRGEGRISKDEVADLFTSATDGQGVTETEKRTLEYIRNNFEFTEAAAKDFDNAFAKL